MGNNLFGANISGLVAQALGPRLSPLKLIKVYQGERFPDNLASGVNPVEEEFSCRGFKSSVRTTVKDNSLSGTQIPRRRDIVYILGDTINGGNTVPEVGDKVLVDIGKPTEELLKIDDVNTDPDRAGYTCQVSS